jgi:microcin C transport system substrate-binding protein
MSRIGVIGHTRPRGTKAVAACLWGLTLIAGICGSVVQATAQEKEWHHGLSLFGHLKYEKGFAHFDYVNPQAPKGGTVRLYNIGTFDSLNPYTFKGRPAGLVSLIYETLMTSSLDEPSSEYPLLAEAVTYPEDYSSVTYRLNPNARWHDGVPVTVDDVIFSLQELKKSHPFFAAYYKNIVGAEKTGEREVTFTFDQAGNRELPQISGEFPILPKHWWTAKGADGKPRSVGESTLEAPLGSGPYRIGEVKPGRSIAVTRVEDYWGKDLPVNVGQNNFDEVRLEYFRDDSIGLEAFKGDQYDWRQESSAKNWATAYDFPAVRSGRVVKEKFRLKNAEAMQAFAFNIRRDKFQDPRVRRAFNLAFDFEWANKNLFYGEYVRTQSYFANSELAATGLPGPKQLEILNPIKDQVPPEVFTEEYKNPVNSSPREQRANLRKARDLLREAGWEIKGGSLVNAKTGEPMEVEFLLVSPTFERVVLPFTQNLERLGIKCSVRTVDASQYQRRLDIFDFDIVVASWQQSLSPGNEQRDFWGSAAAGRTGSRNLVGIKNPAVDHLIDKIIFAKDREGLVAACRALDRVLLWNHYVVPQWHVPYERVARWDRFGKPATMPDFSIGFPTIWWWDEAKAAAVAAK